MDLTHAIDAHAPWIKRLLWQTWHLHRPFGEPQPLPNGITEPTVDMIDWGMCPIMEHLNAMPLEGDAFRHAVKSYQDFLAYSVEPLIARHHPDRRSAAVRLDGQIGPAMLELFQSPRCGCPDYAPVADEEVAEAVGLGPWKRCHNVGDFHAVSIQFTNNPPSWMMPLWPEVKRLCREAYAEAGLLLHIAMPGETPRSPVQIKSNFVDSARWWGLALLGNRSLGCTPDQLWSRFNGSIRAEVSELVTLFKHEWAHNSRYNHTRGGVLNPTILRGLPSSWRTDQLWPTLVQDFGGEPVPIDEPPPDPPPPFPGLWEGQLTNQESGQTVKLLGLPS